MRWSSIFLTAMARASSAVCTASRATAISGFVLDMLSGGVSVRVIHQLDGLLIAVSGVLFGAFRLRDAHRIARFEEFQWQLGIQNHGIKLVAGGNIAAALHQFVLRIDGFDCALGVFANDIFEHHHIAGLPNRIIRFRGNDQARTPEDPW